MAYLVHIGNSSKHLRQRNTACHYHGAAFLTRRRKKIKQEIEPLLLKLMSSIVLFRALDREDMVYLLRGATKATFAPSQIVFEEGASGDAMYVVIAGQFEVFRRMAGGDAHIAFVNPGEHFGEMALLRDKPRTASVQALTPSVALCLSRNTLFSRPSMTVDLLKNMVGLMAEHLSEMNNEVLLLDVSRYRTRKTSPGAQASTDIVKEMLSFANLDQMR